MRAPLRVQFTGNRMCAYVFGNGARLLLLNLRGKLPPWSSRRRVFVVTEATAIDVIAAAEARNWSVAITGEKATQAGVREGDLFEESTASSQDEVLSLW